MDKKQPILENEEPSGEPRPTVATCHVDGTTESIAEITPSNAELLKLAAKFPPPAEWQQADDVDSFFDAE